LTRTWGHPPVVAEYLAGVNAFDADAIVATFAPDAYVNDARREIRGIDGIRRWAEKEMVGDHVTMEPLEVVDHYGDHRALPPRRNLRQEQPPG
jgi:ketosteroid isomerase-like protein